MSDSGTGLIKKLSSLKSLHILLFNFEVFNFLIILPLLKPIELSLTELYLSNSNTFKLLLNWFRLSELP